ncbi:glycosyl hydrolase family 3 N terminal domain-containing protein [Podospora aff. communis PSN243]|uniref:beta-glucosidase n=1 Tax=Podospora aff. communis PSN243 TaxID=3040156 RepID=A0AAV9GLT1_9PEZI|nr:glycosyl hydrolase family 3 N terminal domain-containing protein [Podospora aff. communis PSN243]
MADIDVEAILAKLTVNEKVALLSGIDMWHTAALPSHGVPSLRFSDGPNGIRGTKFFNGVPAACFPCGTSLAATFNTSLLETTGTAMGHESIAKGAHVILGPTINTQRSPLGGRGFESLSEDPVLSGLGAAALIRGIQSTGVQATVKHFVCNDQEDRRNAVQSIVQPRALREIYALPFQICVRDAQPGCVMTAYNGVNGTYVSESKELLEGMLREEWGFKGLVMSDWWGTYSTSDAVNAGLDLEMPGPARFRGELLQFCVNTDKVLGHVLDERARKVLELVKVCAKAGIVDGAEEGGRDTPETAELLRRVAVEGVVLCKNEDGALPLKKDKKTVVIGPNAKVATYHGGGSASLAAYYAVTPYDGIAAKLTTPPPAHTTGAYTHKMLPLLGFQTTTPSSAPGMAMEVFEAPPSTADRTPVDTLTVTKTEMHLVDYTNPHITSPTWYATFTGLFTPDFTGTYEFGLVVCGTAKLFVDDTLIIDNSVNQTLGTAFYNSGTIEEKATIPVSAGQTYTIRVEFGSAETSPLLGISAKLNGGGCLRIGGCRVIAPEDEIARAVDLASSAEQVIICAGLNADWETEGHDRESMSLPGAMDALISAVAKANPNTVVVMQSGTPVAMPWIREVKALVQAWYGGNETGNAIADVLFGDENPSGKLPLSFPVRMSDNPAFLNLKAEKGRTLYGEDVWVGYRYYEFAEREVLFPFGHGLSYTTFGFGELEVGETDGKVTVEVTVTNTGDVKGKEVVQVYVAPPRGQAVNRPVKELKGFAKVELEPGQNEKVRVEVETKYAVSYWDEFRRKFCGEKGEYEVIVSDSSELKEGKVLRGTFKVEETFWWLGV